MNRLITIHILILLVNLYFKNVETMLHLYSYLIIITKFIQIIM
jgi:hypothetical protein